MLLRYQSLCFRQNPCAIPFQRAEPSCPVLAIEAPNGLRLADGMDRILC